MIEILIIFVALVLSPAIIALPFIIRFSYKQKKQTKEEADQIINLLKAEHQSRSGVYSAWPEIFSLIPKQLDP